MSDINYMRNPDVVIREEDEHGALLFNPDTGGIQILNSTAIMIWNLCDGHHNQEMIVAVLHESFPEVPAEQLRADADEFLGGFVTAGLIGVDSAATVS